MFELLFKYPLPVFTKGRYVLLAAWPGWVLALLMVLAAGGLAWLMWRRIPSAAPGILGVRGVRETGGERKGAVDAVAARPWRVWRAWLIWALEAATVALLLVLLWQPAITVAELKSQQNIIAVLVDDSHSMGIADAGSDGHTARETEAVKALAAIEPGLRKRFQVREYRVDAGLTQRKAEDAWKAEGAATHLNSALRELAAETSDLPVGAVVLLTDGAENGTGTSGGGIDMETMNALRNRKLPVHTIGFGRERPERDLEMDDVVVAAKAMADSRMTATVSFHQWGYAGQKATVEVTDGEKVLAAKDVTLEKDGEEQTETMFFNAGDAGVKSVGFRLLAMPDEQNAANNAVTRLVDVSDTPRRILYVEGEPRWEFKFIRRAEEEDKDVVIVSMLRTTENKIYRQGIADPSELADGFPTKAEDLFRYDAIMIGSVEAGYFTPVQQELIREFVDKRGGGVLFLGGRFALADGGWASSGDADLFPTFLPNANGTFHRQNATVELTAAGAESPVTRILDDKAANVERWKKLPYLNDYQDPGTPKPGATVLAEMMAGRRMPLLVTEPYGRGKTAVLATSGTWRWQMSSALGDPSHDLFWQQLLRWLASGSPGQVTASMPEQTLEDEGRVKLTATVRDTEFSPAANAKVTANVIGPDGSADVVEMQPVPNTPGTFAAEWTAEKPGSYVAEVTAEGEGKDSGGLGKDVVDFRREDGVAENFHTEQNREMLKKLSDETGGRYWEESELGELPKEISYSEAGISVRDTKELWDMPAVFLALLGLMSGDWLLRRKWGVV